MSNDDTVAQPVLFPGLCPKPLVATFSEDDTSSDGGAVLLKAADRRLGLLDVLAATMRDDRAAERTQHTVRDLLAQRVFAIALGYPDGNDATRLADDPLHKLLLDRDPIEGRALASQPTISRFEHTATPRTLLRMGHALTDTVIARHQRRHRRAKRIMLDVDVTADPTHGAQQLTFFNGFYGSWCYLPLVAFLTFDDEPRQYLVAAILRPGNAPTTTGVRGLLKRLLPKLWAAFPRARLRVRLDGGFASPETFELLETAGVEYVVAMAKNRVLTALAAPLLQQVRAPAVTTGTTTTTYGEAGYQAKTWRQPRRVIIKAEVVCLEGREPRDNPRFLITNLRQAPRWIYAQVYAARGDSENRLKELHHDLAFGRTSCTRFHANQLRVLLTATAYVLLQELQIRAARTRFARAQVGTLRLALLKIGVRVVRSVRRLVLHLPRAHPAADVWRTLACRLGAVAR